MAKKKASAKKMIEAAKKQLALAKPEKPKITKEEANHRTEEIYSTWIAMGKAWWRLGVEIQLAIEDHVPEALGQSFTEWTQSVFGDGWQKIRRAFLAVKALKGVPTEKLEKISEGNAYVLAHLPEKTRKDSDWIKSAIDMTNEKFRAKAERYIAKKTGLKDPMVPFSEAFGYATLPQSLAKIITQVLKLSCRINDFDWDQKEGRIASTEDVFSAYLTTYQGSPDGDKARQEADAQEMIGEDNGEAIDVVPEGQEYEDQGSSGV